MSNCILIMGVSGSGKTTVGKLLAKQLNLPFLEGDDFHPKTNISKMKSGQPLNDDDRQPWLENLAKAGRKNEKTGFVMASSALKESYRNTLNSLTNNELRIIFLDGSFDLIKNRMEKRAGHFMPSDLLKSQFDTLEKPNNAMVFDISISQEKIIDSILKNIKKADIGIIGLGVMGKSLARNFAGKNIRTAVYNLPFPGEENVTSDFVEKYTDLDFLGGKTQADFLEKLKSPRVILLMIKAGAPVDEMIEKLTPHLNQGDILIDAGNSFFKDSIRRFEYLKKSGIEFVGMGVSGGEEGALKGPSMMPAGSASAKKRLLPMLQKVAAVADEKPCVDWVGEDGAGHFVKMVHNGIEYADMQLLSEIYAIGKGVFNLKNEAIADLLEGWKSTPHDSYLLDITIDILRFRENGEPLLEQILDVAGHKGTGLWTVTEALELGVPIPTISSAMNERILSGKKALREALSTANRSSSEAENGSTKIQSSAFHASVLDSARTPVLGAAFQNTFLFARLIALAEGFDLIKTASEKYGWKINPAEVAQLWRGGCIIRSEMLKMIIEAFEKEPDAAHFFSTKVFADFLQKNEQTTFEFFAEISKTNVPTPALSAAISYYKSLNTNYLAINMIQAQRDYFGAHTYRRLDDRDHSFHANWQTKN